MSRFISLTPIIFACLVAQSFAGDPTTPGPVDAAKAAAPSATQSATADNPSPTNPAQTPAKPQHLDDKTLTQAEVNSLLSQGYKPQKGRGDNVIYCRRETDLGSRFEKKVCLTGDQIKARTQDSKDETERMERNNGNPSGK